MSYCGHIGNVDFMSVDDTMFAFVLGRWVRYCHIAEWFGTLAGKFAKRVCWHGRWIALR